MLARKYRLSKENNFKRLKSAGRKISCPYFRMVVLENNLTQSRFAVAVSLKTSKKATERNKLKRYFLEVIRLNLKEIKSGYDFLIFIGPKSLSLDYFGLEKELLAALKKNNLFGK